MSPQIPDDLVTETEAAAAIKRPMETVRSWRKKGWIHGYRVGARQVRVSLSEVWAYVEPKRIEPPVEPAHTGQE